jgi:hypothetical protein
VTDLTDMWTALEQYQTYANAAGHGKSWRKMTTEQTPNAAGQAAWEAARLAKVTDAAQFAADAAEGAWYAADAEDAAVAERFAAYAVENINKAIGCHDENIMYLLPTRLDRQRRQAL